MFSLCFWCACDYIQRQACMHPWRTRVIMHPLRQHTNMYFKCRSLCVCTWMCTCACAHTCTHMNASIDHIVRTYKYTRTQAHTYIRTRLRTRAYWCLSCDFVLHMTIYNAMPVYTPGALVLSYTNCDRTIMCISSVVVYVCIHECVNAPAHIHAHAWIRALTTSCVHACAHAHRNTRTSTLYCARVHTHTCVHSWVHCPNEFCIMCVYHVACLWAYKHLL